MGARAVIGWRPHDHRYFAEPIAMAVNAAANGRNLVNRHVLRRKPSLVVAGVLVAMAAGLGAADGAQAAATPAQKMPLTQTNRSCDGTVIGAPTTRSFGFAVIRKTGHGRLVVTVAVKGGPADTTYNIRLIQAVAGDADCTGSVRRSPPTLTGTETRTSRRPCGPAPAGCGSSSTIRPISRSSSTHRW